MSKDKLIIIASLIAIAVMLFLGFRRGRGVPETETAVVSRGNLVQSIFASGEIKAKTQRELKFGSSGEVAVVNVSEGDSVAKNQFLSALDQQSLKEALVQAEANLKGARADLDYAGETHRLFYEEHKYDGPSEELFAQFGQQDAQVRKAMAAVELANSQVESARTSLDNSVLTSPIAGMVVEINIKEGEFFNGGQPAIVVADLSEIVFEAEIDETDIQQIEVGQKAVVNLDAYPGTPLEGKVLEIEKIAGLDSSGNKIVKAKIGLNSENLKDLRLGLSGDAEIIQKEKKNILFLPVEAILTEAGESFVYVVKKDGIVRRKVELGLENDDLVEVVSGVSEGEKISVNPDHKSN